MEAVILFFALILSLLIGKMGEKREIGFMWSFLLSFFLSPLIGFLITLFSKKKDSVEFLDMNNNNK